MVKRIGIFVLIFCIAFITKADYWKSPTCKKYYSADSSAYIHVMPACITIYKKGKSKSLDTCSGKCKEKRPCRAIVYKQDHKNIVALYFFELINPYTPHQVFISNDGMYVVSINDWGSAGIGHNVLVIYKNGKIIRHFSLSEISPIPLSDYYRTVSSVWWFGSFEFIDNNIIKISFQNKNKEQFDKYFDLEKIK